MKTSKQIAFDFVLDALHQLDPIIKPMFGCHAVYVSEKIVIVTRKKDQAIDNGIWVATSREHHESLRKILPSLRAISVLGKNPNWQVLPDDVVSFEEEAAALCVLILKGDSRIGTTPKPRKRVKRKH